MIGRPIQVQRTWLLSQLAFEEPGGGGGVELQSKERWAVSTGQQTDSPFKFSSVLVFEEILLRRYGGAAEQLV